MLTVCQALNKTPICFYRLGKYEDIHNATQTLNPKNYLGSVEFQIWKFLSLKVCIAHKPAVLKHSPQKDNSFCGLPLLYQTQMIFFPNRKRTFKKIFVAWSLSVSTRKRTTSLLSLSTFSKLESDLELWQSGSLEHKNASSMRADSLGEWGRQFCLIMYPLVPWTVPGT